MRVCALKFTETARARIVKVAWGDCLGLLLPLFSLDDVLWKSTRPGNVKCAFITKNAGALTLDAELLFVFRNLGMSK